MKHVIWVVYMIFCLLIFGLPLFLRTAHIEKVAGFPEACPAGYSFDITRSACVPLDPPSSTAPNGAALCDDGRILLGRSECGASTLRWLSCPAGTKIHIEEKSLPTVSDALVIPPIGKYGKRYVWCEIKYETEQVYSGGKSHAN